MEKYYRGVQAVKSLPNYLFRPVAIQSFAKMEKSSSREWGKYQVMKSLYRHALQ